jgi:Tol biopolymer transport system component
LLYGRFSPDNRRVFFTARIQPNLGRIAIAPADGPKPVPESAWITIAEAGAADRANWSPDGKTLIYSHPGADKRTHLWAVTLQSGSGAGIRLWYAEFGKGEPVLFVHGGRRSCRR